MSYSTGWTTQSQTAEAALALPRDEEALGAIAGADRMVGRESLCDCAGDLSGRHGVAGVVIID
jgi:hypothetical protein